MEAGLRYQSEHSFLDKFLADQYSLVDFNYFHTESYPIKETPMSRMVHFDRSTALSRSLHSLLRLLCGLLIPVPYFISNKFPFGNLKFHPVSLANHPLDHTFAAGALVRWEGRTVMVDAGMVGDAVQNAAAVAGRYSTGRREQRSNGSRGSEKRGRHQASRD